MTAAHLTSVVYNNGLKYKTIKRESSGITVRSKLL